MCLVQCLRKAGLRVIVPAALVCRATHFLFKRGVLYCEDSHGVTLSDNPNTKGSKTHKRLNSRRAAPQTDTAGIINSEA